MKVQYDCSGKPIPVAKIPLGEWFVFVEDIGLQSYSEISQNNIFQKKKNGEGCIYYLSLIGEKTIRNIRPEDEVYLIELEVKWRFK